MALFLLLLAALAPVGAATTAADPIACRADNADSTFTRQADGSVRVTGHFSSVCDNLAGRFADAPLISTYTVGEITHCAPGRLPLPCMAFDGTPRSDSDVMAANRGLSPVEEACWFAPDEETREACEDADPSGATGYEPFWYSTTLGMHATCAREDCKGPLALYWTSTHTIRLREGQGFLLTPADGSCADTGAADPDYHVLTCTTHQAFTLEAWSQPDPCRIVLELVLPGPAARGAGPTGPC